MANVVSSPDTVVIETTELDDLASSSDFLDRIKAVSHGHKLDVLINDPNPMVRSAVAEQGYSLDKLIYDQHPSVRVAAIAQGVFPDKECLRGTGTLGSLPASTTIEKQSIIESGFIPDELVYNSQGIIRKTVVKQGYDLGNYVDDPSSAVREAVIHQGYDPSRFSRNDRLNITHPDPNSRYANLLRIFCPQYCLLRSEENPEELDGIGKLRPKAVKLAFTIFMLALIVIAVATHTLLSEWALLAVWAIWTSLAFWGVKKIYSYQEREIDFTTFDPKAMLYASINLNRVYDGKSFTGREKSRIQREAEKLWELAADTSNPEAVNAQIQRLRYAIRL